MLIKPIEIETKWLASFLNTYPDFFWLDSADKSGFSLMAFDATETRKFDSDSNPAEFQNFLNNEIHSNKKYSELISTFSFAGGWIGYICYEAFAFNETLSLKPTFYKSYPVARFSHYDTFIHIEEKTGEKFFVSFATDANKKWNSFCNALHHFVFTEHPIAQHNSQGCEINCNTSKQRYQSCLAEIHELLESGEFFEINYTMEFSSIHTEKPLNTYLRLREISPAPMMVYANLSELQILSSSPERFFRIENNLIKTYPIKGTTRRSTQVEEDNKLKQELSQSEKNLAELLMVTDLMRNDLGKICETGSVKVNQLASIHTFSHYHHLISEIEGTLLGESKLGDVFNALFPGGSITGAPKIKVMQHIDRLEQRARGVYTGAIGYISHNGVVDFNIPIRTMIVEKEKISFAAGGGIVADSKCEEEYNECITKTAGLRQALGF